MLWPYATAKRENAEAEAREQRGRRLGDDFGDGELRGVCRPVIPCAEVADPEKSAAVERVV